MFLTFAWSQNVNEPALAVPLGVTRVSATRDESGVAELDGDGRVVDGDAVTVVALWPAGALSESPV